MSNQYEPENLAAENERSLQTLVRAITLSQGEFSLILLRCNYAAFRQDMVERLHQLSPIKIREITLPVSVKTLYTSIGKELGDEQPPALMVFGLESVKDIDTVLTSTNQVREEFRKNFPFPVLLLVNDQVLQKLIRLAADFENWATIIHFAIATDDLVQFIKQTSEDVFAKVLDAGAGKFLDNSALNLAIGSPHRVELELAQAELQKRGVKLDTELEASLEFVLGRDAVSMELSRQHYERSLALWQQSSKLEKQGCVLHNLGLWWRTYAIQNLTKHQPACLQAKSYFHQCLEVFEQANRPDLVAKFINALGEVLQQLQQWDELEKVAQKALELYQIYPDWFREARAYGFLAEVALAKSTWNKAKQSSEKALSIVDINQSIEPNANLELVRYYHQGWYLFSLARAQHQLHQLKDALVNLETARRETKPQYDPQLYILILKSLRDIYYQQCKYFDAFQIKQEQIQVEHQYGFRAFIGAAYLNPQHEVINPALVQVENSVRIAQEIAVSGRQKDVNRLLERMSRNDHKLTVFHGHSGVGKSSILIGGLLPAMKLRSIDARDVLPIVVRVYTDWIGVLTKYLTDNVSSSNSIEFICEKLRVNAERNLLTVLIFDQLEEFFVYTDKSKRQPFYQFLHLCLDIPFVKVILCLREDYLYYLLECDRLFNFTAINNNILDKHIRYELKNLSSEDAKAVVQSLTTQTNFYLESALIDQLVEDLSEEGEVRPIELQIVGAQLQTHKITTLEKYLQSGPKEKLVEGFLEEVIKDCGSENERCARVVLYLLTDENRTRPLKTCDNLAEELKAADIVSDEEKLNLVLEILVGSGLVLNSPEDPANRYQLVHDYLVSFIRQSQQARELEEQKQEKEQRQQVEAQLNRVLKGQRNGAIAGGIIMSILTVLSVGFSGQAESQKLEAESQKTEAESQKREVEFQKREVEKNRIIAISKTSEALFASGQRFDALKEGIKAGISLKQLPSRQNNDKKNIYTQVKAALQQPLYWLVERNRLERHEGLIWGMNLSPDGEIIASASFDHTVKLWRRDGTLIKTLEGHKNKALSVNFSPDGKIIASGDFDGTVILWKRDGTFVKKFKAHDSKDSNGVYGISFSPDGQIFATASRDKTVKIWKADGTFIKTFQEHGNGVTSVAFSPDGQTIATSSRDKALKLWTRNGKLLKTFNNAHEDFIWAIAWSPDGKIIATAGRDNLVKLWNLDLKVLKTFEGHKERVMSVSFSPDGKIIASASQDKTVNLWKLDKKSDGTLEGSLLTTLSGHTNGVYSARFSPDCQNLITASADSTIKIWQLDAGSFLGKGDRLTSTCADSTIKGGRLGSGVLSTLNSHSNQVNKVSFSPDGQIIASASYDRTVKLWRRDDGTLFKTLEGHEDQVNSVTFSPDGQIIASASADKTVKLWKQDGTLIKTLTDFTDKILDVSFSPDGQFLAAGSVDNTVKIWRRDGDGEFKTKPDQILKDHRDWVRGVAWSKDSNFIASASDDNTIKLWQRDRNQKFKIYKTLKGEYGHKSWVYSVSFSHDGKMIATTSNDKTAILWKQDSEGEFRFYKKLRGHNDEVQSVAFSFDDQIVATASDDKTVKLWKLDGTLIRTLSGHGAEILSVSFSPDGKSLALGSADHTVILWHLQQLDSLDDLLTHGCDWLHDYLKDNRNVSKSDRHLCDDIK